MNHRIKWLGIFIFSVFLFSMEAANAAVDDYVKNIEISESSININHQEFPPTAYLYMTLKNNGARKVSNITFEISYYGKEGYLIKKAVIKNALNDAMPAGESRKYKVRLNGDVVSARNEQYPYSQAENVTEFDVKIESVKLASR